MISIAQISDTHIDAGAGGPRSRLDDLSRVIAAINALHPRPVAVLHTGDVAHYGAPADYDAAKRVLARLVIPLYAIPGNRDRRQPFRAAFAGDGYLPVNSAFIQYGAELGPIRLVALDTFDEESGLGAYCPAREQQAQALLDATGSAPVLVMLHHPPVAIPTLPRQPLQFRQGRDADVLQQAISRRRQVIGVVAGHVHRSDCVALGAANLTTMPSIAVDLRRERTPYGYTTRPIFHLHRFDGDSFSTASVVVG